MKTLRVVIFVVVAFIQLSVPASMVWKREKTLKDGRVWKFKTEPVDPADMVRGRYVALRFAAATITSKDGAYQKFASGTKAYFVLKEDAEGFAKIERISEKPLSGDNIIIGEIRYFLEEEEGVSFPFDRFWVTEKDAPAAEKAYRDNSRRDKQNAYVTVRVRDGDAALEQLFIDNQPLREYLRAHSSPKK